VANQNFKVKKGLEVGTGVTISGVDGNINISGIITATQFAGDGSGLTGVTAEGSGVSIRDEGSLVGTAATINFIGGNVVAVQNGAITDVTVSTGGLSNVVEDTTPQLGGNLDLNGKNITGIGSISITGSFNATGVSTFQENVVFQSTASFGDNDKINAGTGNDLQIYHNGTNSFIDNTTGSLLIRGANGNHVRIQSPSGEESIVAAANGSVDLYYDNSKKLETTNTGVTVTGTLAATALSGSLATTDLTGNITDAQLASTFLKNVVEDTTPQLGGNLDVNSKDITGTGNVSLTGVVTATSFSGSGVGLTSIPAGQLTGTVADARLSTVTSSKLSGSLPALDGSALTGLTGASAGTYGASTNTPIITVDSNGRITGISTVATSGAGGGGGISNIIEDTTPQLGGNLDLNSKNINGTGNIDITGYAAVSGVSTFSGAVGFATHIHDAGTGGLDIRTNLLRIKNDADSETLATFAQDGAVSLYHDNALRIQTTTGGATVSGILTATTYVKASNSGGFLKADGTEDTSTYLTSETDPIVGAINGIVKANGSGTISAAVAGTDYLTPTGDGSGLTGIAGTAFSNVQVTWNVTSSGSSAYRFTGPGNDASDNNPDLYLVRGQRYRFTNNSGGSHPFQIRSSPGGSAYSTGVTNNGGASGNIDFNVQHDAPSRLYYQCTNHSGMVGNIYIVGGSDWRMTDVNTSTAPEIYTTRNVGIGTDNPQANLHIFEGTGSTQAPASSGNNLVIDGNSEVGMSLLFGTDANTAYGNIYWGNSTDGSADGRITYFGSTYTTAADRQSMTFRTAGTERLRIESDGDFRLSNSNAGTNYGGIRGWNSSTGDMIIDADKSATGTGTSKSNLIFRSRGSERLRITSAGEIQTKARSAGVRRMILSGSPSNDAFNIEAHDGATGTSSGDVQGKFGLFYNDGSTLTNTANISFERGSGAADGAMAFVTNQTERLRIDSDGSAFFKGGSDGTKGTINIESNDPFIRFYDTNGTADRRKWDIRLIGAGGFEELDFRIVNDANNSFSSRMQIEYGGDVNISDGNLRVADGHGIDFSANGNNSGMTSELLDDYEEGTWTPTVYGSSSAGTFNVYSGGSNNGYYVKIGQYVHMIIRWKNVYLTGATGNLYLGNLPFSFDDTNARLGGFSSYLEGFTPTYNKSFNGSQSLFFRRQTATTLSFRPSTADEWDVYLNASTTDWQRNGGNSAQWTYGEIHLYGHTPS